MTFVVMCDQKSKKKKLPNFFFLPEHVGQEPAP